MSKDTNVDANIREYFTMIQNVITRLAQNSFKIKAWYTTIFVAIIVLTFSYLNFIIKLIIYPILLMIGILFWFLDSYYLQQERLFRRLYNFKVDEFNNEAKKKELKIFDMDVRPFKKEEEKITRIMLSTSEILFYIPFISILVSLIVLELIFLYIP